MNIFENYLSKINKVILDNKDNLKLTILENLDNINLEVPPNHFNYDLSSNVSLVLAKSNKLNTINLAEDIKDLLLIIEALRVLQYVFKNNFQLTENLHAYIIDKSDAISKKNILCQL